MRVAQINGGVFGSTGKIMFGIANVCEQAGHATFCASPITTTNRYRQPNHEYYPIGNFHSRRFHVLLDRLTGKQSGHAHIETKRLLKRLDVFSPDIVQLHNLHGSYINLPMLFGYLQKRRIHTVWTLHDCWAFTGHCPHFDMIGCDKWRTGCHHCPQYRGYPQSIYDNSRQGYHDKKQLFTGLDHLHIVTPSVWLGELAKQSFLGKYPVTVINNGINPDVFVPTASDFRQRYGLENKKVVLGVAFGWGDAKGLDVLIALSKRLPADYQVVLVGTDDQVDATLPSNILSIHRTQNQQELAEIYTAADVLANPTRQETLGLVNIEALACGTPVVTFASGGSPECLDASCGAVVPRDDVEGMLAQVMRICEDKPYTAEECRQFAVRFDEKKKYEDYIQLYHAILNDEQR